MLKQSINLDLFQLNPTKMRVKVITQLLYLHTQLMKITFVVIAMENIYVKKEKFSLT